MQIRIHSEGRVYFISTIILATICLPFFPILAVFLFAISLYIFYFFRDPVRSVPYENVIVSPADGIVTFVGECVPPQECKITNKYIKISIFLSIFNVHVNRIPVSGIVEKIFYISGKFLNAKLDKSSDENERNIVVIKNKKNDLIVVTQIAGLIARRIVNNLKVSENVLKGERYGIIKFGSRVDLYLPMKYNIMVNIGQSVIGGETIVSNPNQILNINKINQI